MQATLSRLLRLCSVLLLLALLLSGMSIPEGKTMTSGSDTPFFAAYTPFGITGSWRPLRSSVSTRTKRKAPAAITAMVFSQAANSASLLPAVDKADIKEKHRELADRVLRTMPSLCRDNLKNFFVRYDNPERRGLGGKTTMIIDGTVNDTEFMALMVHECGHVIHSNLPGNPLSGESAFRDGAVPFYKDSPIVGFFSISWENEKVLKEKARDRDFVSGYAKHDPFEDFGETFAAYVLHEEALEKQGTESEMIRRKLAWMRQNLPLEKDVSASNYTWSKKVPWDITKLAYQWR
jgi:hypothetical protein